MNTSSKLGWVAIQVFVCGGSAVGCAVPSGGAPTGSGAAASKVAFGLVVDAGDDGNVFTDPSVAGLRGNVSGIVAGVQNPDPCPKVSTAGQLSESGVPADLIPKIVADAVQWHAAGVERAAAEARAAEVAATTAAVDDAEPAQEEPKVLAVHHCGWVKTEEYGTKVEWMPATPEQLNSLSQLLLIKEAGKYKFDFVVDVELDNEARERRAILDSIEVTAAAAASTIWLPIAGG